jgi:hypothetical protein
MGRRVKRVSVFDEFALKLVWRVDMDESELVRLLVSTVCQLPAPHFRAVVYAVPLLDEFNSLFH